MHILYSTSFDTNNNENDTNEAIIENVDKWAELPSIKHLIKTFRMCIRFDC